MTEIFSGVTVCKTMADYNAITPKDVNMLYLVEGDTGGTTRTITNLPISFNAVVTLLNSGASRGDEVLIQSMTAYGMTGIKAFHGFVTRVSAGVTYYVGTGLSSVGIIHNMAVYSDKVICYCMPFNGGAEVSFTFENASAFNADGYVINYS